MKPHLQHIEDSAELGSETLSQRVIALRKNHKIPLQSHKWLHLYVLFPKGVIRNTLKVGEIRVSMKLNWKYFNNNLWKHYLNILKLIIQGNHVRARLQRPEEDTRSPGTRFTGNCDLPHGSWEQKLGPLQEQPELKKVILLQCKWSIFITTKKIQMRFNLDLETHLKLCCYCCLPG